MEIGGEKLRKKEKNLSFELDLAGTACGFCPWPERWQLLQHPAAPCSCWSCLAASALQRAGGLGGFGQGGRAGDRVTSGWRGPGAGRIDGVAAGGPEVGFGQLWAMGAAGSRDREGFRSPRGVCEALKTQMHWPQMERIEMGEKRREK